jgi:hypothetical protein
MKGLATSTAKTSLGQAIPAYRFPEKKSFAAPRKDIKTFANQGNRRKMATPIARRISWPSQEFPN